MRTASVIARYFAGVIFLVMGLNGFLNFIPLPPPGGISGQFLGSLYASHYRQRIGFRRDCYLAISYQSLASIPKSVFNSPSLKRHSFY